MKIRKKCNALTDIVVFLISEGFLKSLGHIIFCGRFISCRHGQVPNLFIGQLLEISCLTTFTYFRRVFLGVCSLVRIAPKEAPPEGYTSSAESWKRAGSNMGSIPAGVRGFFVRFLSAFSTFRRRIAPTDMRDEQLQGVRNATYPLASSRLFASVFMRIRQLLTRVNKHGRHSYFAKKLAWDSTVPIFFSIALSLDEVFDTAPYRKKRKVYVTF